MVIQLQLRSSRSFSKKMKTSLLKQLKPALTLHFRILIVASVALIFAGSGCSTFPKSDWDANVGELNYDQVVIEMGPPASQAELKDGSIVAEWLLRRGRDRFFMMNTSPGFGVQNVTEMSSPDFYLRLVFDSEGTLKSWKRVAK